MSGGTFGRDGIALRYVDTGKGRPMIFQHGLGGDEAQVADVVPEAPAMRRVTLECRGQGGSGFGGAEGFSIAAFTDDVEALADALALGPVVAGGISMGAAIALRLAVRHPARVRALVLARPAWVDRATPDNLRPYALVGDLLQRLAPDAARAAFARSETARMLAREAPDNLASLTGFFDRRDPRTFGALLSAIAADGPGVSRDEIRALDLPVLVIGNGQDLAHPHAMAEDLAALIPNARLVRIPAKAESREGYRDAFRAAVSAFLGGLA